ncbi:pppde peptidase domain protein, partial [Cystoisospora suis]
PPCVFFFFLFGRNCLNFANQLCLLLGVGSLPSWLLRLQQQASHLQKTVQQAARRLQEFDETTGISAVATAAATAAMAAARVFGGLLIQPSQPSLMTGGGEATSVGSRIDRAFTSGMSFLSGGLGAFADGVAEGLAGILDDPQEEEEEVASSPYPEGREREGGVEVTEEEQEEERRKEEERKEEEDHARFHQHDDSHLRSERQEALLSSSPFSPSPSDFSSSSSSSDPFIEDLSKRHFKEEGEEQKEVLDNLKIHEGLR